MRPWPETGARSQAPRAVMSRRRPSLRVYQYTYTTSAPTRDRRQSKPPALYMYPPA